MCSNSKASETFAFQQEPDDCIDSHSSLRSRPNSVVLLPSPEAVPPRDYRIDKSLASSPALWLGPSALRLDLSAAKHQQPWWEIDGLEILRSRKVNLVPGLLRFRLYGNKESLQDGLRDYSLIELDKILCSLATREPQPVAINKEQKVDQILDLVEPILLSCDFGSVWRPSEMANMDAPYIASCIHDESCAFFREVRFEDWVRHALGYAEQSVIQLFRKHKRISFRIRRYISANPMERETFSQVEEVSRLRLEGS